MAKYRMVSIGIAAKDLNQPNIGLDQADENAKKPLHIDAGVAYTHRDFITPDDIKDMAVPTLVHRLILRPEFEIEGLTVQEVIRDILQNVAVPR